MRVKRTGYFGRCGGSEVSSRRGVGLLVAAMVVLGGCVRPAAPSPTYIILRPEIVGVIVSLERGPHGGTAFTLDSGDVVEIGYRAKDGTTATPRLSNTDIWLENDRPSPGESVVGASTLIVAGHDAAGKLWYIAAPGYPPGTGPCSGGYAVQAPGIYDEGFQVHLTTGPVLRKTQQFYDWLESGDNPFPLNSGDALCLDATGAAWGVDIFRPF